MISPTPLPALAPRTVRGMAVFVDLLITVPIIIIWILSLAGSVGLSLGAFSSHVQERPWLTQFGQTCGGLPNVYAEIGSTFANNVVTWPTVCAHMFGQLLKYFGEDRIVFGSDWPHGEGLESPVAFTEELTAFGDSDIRKIMRDNALDLLGVKVGSAA